MADPEAQLTEELVESVRDLSKHSEEVEQMLMQTLQALSKLGNQAPFDISGIVGKGRVARQGAQKSSQKVIQHLVEMEELVRTSALITTSLEIQNVLEEVVDTVISLTGAERAFLILLEGTEHKVVAARNDLGDSISPEGITFSTGVIQSALETGNPIVTVNAQEDERFQNMQSVVRNDLRSIMVIPMRSQGKALGVLYLDNRISAAVFHKKSVPVINAFANQAAIAIENARLFEKVQENLNKAKQEVQRLRIQLDDSKMQSEVAQITDSNYFQELSEYAKSRRSSPGKSES
jgi:transcriptional regulator with GAF, ATPase, and Fis domain